MAAAGLTLFEHLQNKAQTAEPRDAANRPLRSLRRQASSSSKQVVGGGPGRHHGRSFAHALNGIQEITNVLLESYDLDDIMFIILEPMYRAFGFNRVIFCMLDRSRTVMSGRLGFGEDIQEVLTDFSFKPSLCADVLSLAVLQVKDFLIGDCDASDVSEQIPQWYRKSIAAPAFILYPLTLKDVSLGLFHADREHKGSVLSPRQMNCMKTLRNQAILAVKRKL